MIDQHIHHHPVAGGAIAYAWSHGRSPQPLIMLHGLGDSAILTFRERVARGPLGTTPVLYIDLPGFGKSTYTSDHPATIDRYADDIADLLHARQIQPAAIFGHSMGGNIAIALADRHPTLVPRLIVAEPLSQAEQSLLASEILRTSEEIFVRRRYAMLVRATSLQAHRGELPAGAFLEPLQHANPTAMYRAARALIDGADANFQTLLQSSGISRTFIMGDRTPGSYQQLELAGIHVVRIPNAGHFMLVEQEIATTCAILEAMT